MTPRAFGFSVCFLPRTRPSSTKGSPPTRPYPSSPSISSSLTSLCTWYLRLGSYQNLTVGAAGQHIHCVDCRGMI
ncbi:hypothetical protein J6590_094720, partial [Homalodisca vitripennis]